MVRYIAKKYIILGANNRHFVACQELPIDVDQPTIDQLLEDALIKKIVEPTVTAELVAETEESATIDDDILVEKPKRIKKKKE